jgi:hypothetical protein
MDASFMHGFMTDELMRKSRVDFFLPHKREILGVRFKTLVRLFLNEKIIEFHGNYLTEKNCILSFKKSQLH